MAEGSFRFEDDFSIDAGDSLETCDYDITLSGNGVVYVCGAEFIPENVPHAFVRSQEVAPTTKYLSHGAMSFGLMAHTHCSVLRRSSSNRARRPVYSTTTSKRKATSLRVVQLFLCLKQT